ncbi:type VI secretion system baseplate subunit TssG [Ectothiorhodospira shaposhnikovii]|uniref:type VI secretion system baseplate subunit TssG n=1 Tax=Ectothiorhodospira shaposhnikovii TaxID=1054 RepID=UPI00399FD9F6
MNLPSHPAHAFGLLELSVKLAAAGAGLPTLVPSADLDFPAGPVARVRRLEAGDRMETSLPGLRGAHSPLPLEDLEALCREDPDAETLRAFLDLLDRPLQGQMLRACLASRPHLPAGGDGPPPLLRYLNALKPTGLPTAAGLKVRIKRRLEDMEMPGLEVTIHLGWYCRRPLPEPTRLGRHTGACLGRDAALGEEARVPEGLRIDIGPLPPCGITTWHDVAASLTREIRDYLGPSTPFEVALRLTPTSPEGLGSENLGLGLNSILGEGAGTDAPPVISLAPHPLTRP